MEITVKGRTLDVGSKTTPAGSGRKDYIMDKQNTRRGRPQKYGEPTKCITVRLPKSVARIIPRPAGSWVAKLVMRHIQGGGEV